MRQSSPLPAFNFTVVFLDARPPAGAADLALAAAGTAAGVGSPILTVAFSEVTGLNAEMETEEYREGGFNTGPRKFVKWGKFPNLVLKRGVTSNTDLWDWNYQVLYGTRQPPRKNGFVLLADRGGGASAALGGATTLGLPGIDRTPAAVWFFRNALPERLQGPALNAKSNELAIETLELAHEGLTRIGPASIAGAAAAFTGRGF